VPGAIAWNSVLQLVIICRQEACSRLGRDRTPGLQQGSGKRFNGRRQAAGRSGNGPWV